MCVRTRLRESRCSGEGRETRVVRRCSRECVKGGVDTYTHTFARARERERERESARWLLKKLELEGVVVRVRCMRRVRRDNCSMLRQLLPPPLQGQGQEEW